MPDPCLASPCLNEGTCTSDGRLQFTCVCPMGYIGQICEIRKFTFHLINPVIFFKKYGMK